MAEEPLPNRQSIRCKGWDYTAPGWYFLTFNTKARRPVFGTIVNGRMALNAAGRIAAEEWHKSAEIRPNLAFDEFVIMPDHVHGIVRIVAREGDLPDARTSRGDQQVARQQVARQQVARQHAPRLLPRSLGAMVAGFKGAVGKRVNVLQGTPGAALWHRNYWDVIVRDDLALARIRAYIRDNPRNAHAVLQSGPPRLLGNPALLQRPRLGFLASRGESVPHGKLPLQPGEAILSGFLSPMERAVFRAGLAARRPMIWVKPFGLTHGSDSAAIQTAIAEERLLILSPFDDAIEAPSARRAVWCNHYVIANSTRLVVGHLNPDGLLACLLCETPPDLEIQYL
jgi:putative transposase